VRTRDVRRSLFRSLSVLGWTRRRGSDGEEGSWKIATALGVGFERRRFSDVGGEIGLGAQDADDRALRVHGRIAGQWSPTPWFGVATMIAAETSEFDPDDPLAPAPIGASTRQAAQGGLELRWSPRIAHLRTEIRPSARMEVVSSRTQDIRPGAAGAERSTTTVAPTFRLGALVELARGLALVGSLASGMRVPHLREFFGDRGFVVGNPNLSPERSLSGDFGVSARTHTRPLSLTLDARGFVTRIDDLIRYTLNDQFQALPENVGRADLYGVEVRGVLSGPGPLRLTTAVTWIEAQDRSLDRRLPLRPRLETFVKPELDLGSLGPLDGFVLFSEGTYVSSNFADAANLVILPSRFLWDLGTRLDWSRHYSLALVVRNLLDVRVQDTLGYPLPGLAAFATLNVRTSL
ncbi:MAG: TonB-dependent receptor, partial [Myxococcales bacterium]|nr:TonB-dependent receptor [Myxococcales bacterium]